MKTMNLCSLLFVGTLALFTVSCREENRDNNRYDTDRREDRDYRDVRDDGDYTRDRDNNDYREVKNTTTVSSGREMLIGDGDKYWKVREDLNRTGADEGLERSGEFHFHSNNSFSMSDEDQATRTGTWSYNGSTFSIKYSGEATTHTYKVRDLTNNRLRLEASDGSELVLVDKDFR